MICDSQSEIKIVARCIQKSILSLPLLFGIMDKKNDIRKRSIFM